MASRAASFGALLARAKPLLASGTNRGSKPHAMEKLDYIARSLLTQKRKHRRFSLQYPVCLRLDSDHSIVELEAVSRNISIGGLLLETSSMIPQHTPLSFIVTVRGAQIVHPIQFAGQGKVVRVDEKTTQSCFAIAVECARPIAQINTQLPAGEN